MKVLLTIILTFILYTNAYLQVMTVTNQNMNILYKWIANPLSIVVENYPCSKIIAKSDCGNLEKIQNCNYEFTSDSSCNGSTTIQVNVIDSGKTKFVGSIRFRIKNLPNPTAKIANQEGGYISKYLLSASGVIIPTLENFNFGIYYFVKNYSFSIIRNDTLVFNKIQNKENKFTQEIKDEIMKTLPNDVVLFYNISALAPYNTKEEMILNEIKFIIK